MSHLYGSREWLNAVYFFCGKVAAAAAAAAAVVVAAAVPTASFHTKMLLVCPDSGHLFSSLESPYLNGSFWLMGWAGQALADKLAKWKDMIKETIRNTENTDKANKLLSK